METILKSKVNTKNYFELRVYKLSNPQRMIYSEIGNSSVVQYKVACIMSTNGFQEGKYKIEIVKSAKERGAVGKLDFC